VAQTELAYWAKVALTNGTTIDIRAGDASIATSDSETRKQSVANSSVRFDDKSAAFKKRDSGRKTDAEDDDIQLKGLHVTIHHSGVTDLQQGQNVTLIGRIEEGSSNQYDLTHARLLLQYRDRPTWAVEQLRRDQRYDLMEELENANGYPKVSYERWNPFADARQMTNMRETAFDRWEELHGPGQECNNDLVITHSFSGKMEDTFEKITGQDFALMLNVSKRSAIAPLKSTFRDLQARILLQVIVTPKQLTNDSTETALTGDQHIKARLKGWPTIDTGSGARCKRSTVFDAEQTTNKPSYLLYHDLGQVSVSPRKTVPIWRDAELAAQFEAFECFDNSTLPGPRFVLVGEGSMVTRAGAEKACQSNWNTSAHLKHTSNGQTYVNVDKDTLPREETDPAFTLHKRDYDPWSTCRTRGRSREIPLIASGSCTMNVGALWAEHIFNSKQILEDDEKKAPLPVQQRQQAVFGV
jgi:hypothetical protein